MARSADSQLAVDLREAFERAAGRHAPPPAKSSTVAVSLAERPRLSVALASHNRREALGGALEALAAQTYPPDRFEVVIVLDGSTDGSGELVRSLAMPYHLELVEQPNAGLASTRNRGADRATNDVLVFVDDDITLEPNCLEKYATAHQAAGRDSLVLGAAVPVVAGADAWSRWIADWWQQHYRRKAEPGHRWTFVDVADGMASLPRRLFLDSGGFDESFRERRQDWEWGVRLLEAGVPMSQSLEARGRHEVDTTIAAAIRYARQEGRSDVQLATKHPQVRGRLPLARFAARREQAAGFVARHAGATAAGARAFQWVAVPLARASRSQAALHRVVGLLRSNSYVLGLRDALGSAERLQEFIEPVARGADAETISVDLEQPRPLEVPPVGGELRLSVTANGDEMVRVPAIEPGEQWDWDALTDRVVAALLERGVEPGRVSPLAGAR